MLKTAVKGMVIGTTAVVAGYVVYKKIREKQIEKIAKDFKNMADEVVKHMEEMENK